MSDDPFVFCCENALPPVVGLHNAYATLTTVPMWLVPLVPLRRAVSKSMPAPVLLWLVVLTVLFISGTVQHAVGPDHTPALFDPVPLGIAQNALLAGCFVRAPMALSAALAVVPMATAAYWPKQRKLVCDTLDALLSPCVIGIMGYRAWKDAHSWRLLLRALVSFVSLMVCTLLEPKLCGLPGAVFFHAIAIHLSIALLFGHVSTLALRLLEHHKAA